MVSKCPFKGCQAYGLVLEANNIIVHFKKFHGTEEIELLKSKKAILKLKYDGDVRGKDKDLVKASHIIAYEGAHLLFVVTRHNSRHYFWLHATEDGDCGRQFHGQLELIPNNKTVSKRESEPINIIYSVNTPMEEIIRKTPPSSLFYVTDKELKKYFLKENNYRLGLSLKEIDIKDKSHPTVKNTQVHLSCDDGADMSKNSCDADDKEESQLLKIYENKISKVKAAQMEQPMKGEEEKYFELLEKVNLDAGNSSEPIVKMLCPIGNVGGQK